MRKRSSCASGSGNVPSYSIGFCVAITMNGSGVRCVMPSTVTCRSSIASRSADCAFGVARLISSARTTCERTGPGRNSKSPRLLVVDGDAGDVGGQEVGRELDAAERAAAGAGEAAREHRLADAGDVLDQQVAAAHQDHHGKLHLGALADDDPLYVIDEALGGSPGIQTGRLASGALGT